MAQWAYSFQPLFTCALARHRMEKVNSKRSDPFLFSFFFPSPPSTHKEITKCLFFCQNISLGTSTWLEAAELESCFITEAYLECSKQLSTSPNGIKHKFSRLVISGGCTQMTVVSSNGGQKRSSDFSVVLHFLSFPLEKYNGFQTLTKFPLRKKYYIKWLIRFRILPHV